jgi:hypothetical protein
MTEMASICQKKELILAYLALHFTVTAKLQVKMAIITCLVIYKSLEITNKE